MDCATCAANIAIVKKRCDDAYLILKQHDPHVAGDVEEREKTIKKLGWYISELPPDDAEAYQAADEWIEEYLGQGGPPIEWMDSPDLKLKSKFDYEAAREAELQRIADAELCRIGIPVHPRRHD